MTLLQSRTAVQTPPPLEDAITRHVRYSLGKEWDEASKNDMLQAAAFQREHDMSDTKSP